MGVRAIKIGNEAITRITVGGVKSISQEKNLEIKPLTILAGANSSGKSSIIQPLLLLKQTLEATYDPGPLLLNGPNVKFTSTEQLLSRTHNEKTAKVFHVGITIAVGSAITTSFKQSTNKGFDVEETTYSENDGKIFRLFMGMPQNEIQSVYDRSNLGPGPFQIKADDATLEVVQDRCFLKLNARLEDKNIFFWPIPLMKTEKYLEDAIQRIIHLPGLRGNPARDYPVTAVGPTFPGPFEAYVASIIERWQRDNDNERLEKLNTDLARLALTKKVVARRRNDTQIELVVNRFLQSDREDMVSIADVGLGVSQALPVIVALHTAMSGQFVYIEQPEIHLHPRAQSMMAEVLADAAIQGKRLIVETHSSLLLRGVQTLVAEGKLSPELVKLHWFRLLEDGSTEITSADLDETGAYGDWPEDFDTVMLESENRYLNAAEDK
jgi:predicted ATPase